MFYLVFKCFENYTYFYPIDIIFEIMYLFLFPLYIKTNILVGNTNHDTYIKMVNFLRLKWDIYSISRQMVFWNFKQP
jgi:hypothetical protein